MHIETDIKLEFSDVLLKPKRSDVNNQFNTMYSKN